MFAVILMTGTNVYEKNVCMIPRFLQRIDITTEDDDGAWQWLVFTSRQIAIAVTSRNMHRVESLRDHAVCRKFGAIKLARGWSSG